MLESIAMDREATRVIEALGGPQAVAALCDVSHQAVYQWKDKGFPKARRQYFALLRPDLFARPQHAEQATSV
jgi:hypothetical protein